MCNKPSFSAVGLIWRYNPKLTFPRILQTRIVPFIWFVFNNLEQTRKVYCVFFVGFFTKVFFKCTSFIHRASNIRLDCLLFLRLKYLRTLEEPCIFCMPIFVLVSRTFKKIIKSFKFDISNVLQILAMM